MSPTPASTRISPIQDWDAIAQQYSPASLLRKVLESFVKNHQHSSQELRNQLAGQDFVAFGKLAHKVKGAACIMQAPLIIQCAEQIEHDLRETGTIASEHAEQLACLMDQWMAEIGGKLADLV